jgi:hypothetical protein
METASTTPDGNNHKAAVTSASDGGLIAARTNDYAELISRLASKLNVHSIGDFVVPLRDRLQALLGFTEIIAEELDGKIADDQQRFLERVRLGLHGLDLSLSNLIETASAARGADAINAEAFTVGELISEVMPTLRYLCRYKQVAFEVNIKNPELKIVSDWRRLRSIVLNLASAMVEHFGGGKLTVAITLISQPSGSFSNGGQDCEALKLELCGRDPSRAKPAFTPEGSAKGSADPLKIGCESDLGATLAHYHVVAMGGTIRFSVGLNGTYTLTGQIPVKTTSRRRVALGRGGRHRHAS